MDFQVFCYSFREDALRMQIPSQDDQQKQTSFGIGSIVLQFPDKLTHKIDTNPMFLDVVFV